MTILKINFSVSILIIDNKESLFDIRDLIMERFESDDREIEDHSSCEVSMLLLVK